MRVLHLIDSLAGGGAERSLVELLPDLQARGVDQAIVTLEPATGPLADLASRVGVPVETARGRKDVTRIAGVREVIQRASPQILHTTLVRSDVVGRLASRGLDLSVLTSLVNTTYDPVRREELGLSKAKLALIRSVDGWTARHFTDRFHAITQAVKRAAVDALRIRPDLVTVIERGRDTERLGTPSPERTARARARLGFAEDDVLVVTVGRQDVQKGQDILVAAFDMVAARVPRARLLLVGRPGSATATIQEVISRSSFRDRIACLGERDDVPDLLAASDLFVFPSLYEGLGGAVIEAMALELPVIASDLPALGEVVDDRRTGVLVPRGDVDALAQAMTKLLLDPALRRQLGGRGRQRFMTKFTLERSAEGLVHLYRELLAARTTAGNAGGHVAD